MSSDTNSAGIASFSVIDDAPRTDGRGDQGFMGLNQKSVSALMAAFHKIKGKEAAHTEQRQALFLILFTDQDLGGFNGDKTAGLLGMDQKLARKWLREELKTVTEAASRDRFMHPATVQSWRLMPAYDDALQELGVIPSRKPLDIPAVEPAAPLYPDEAYALKAKRDRRQLYAFKEFKPPSRTTEIVPEDRTRDMVQALGEILKPGSDGLVRFGAQNEALKLSQVEALTAIRETLQEGETVGHVVKPGGTGKTRDGIVLAYAMHLYERNSLYVIPGQQALEDFAKKAKDLCPDLIVGSVYAGEKTIGRLTFITYASLVQRTLGDKAAMEVEELAEADRKVAESYNGGKPVPLRKLKLIPTDYDLVVWDEAHEYLTLLAQKALDKFGHAINIAFDATPRYYEGKDIAQVFGLKLYELSLADARARGEISDYVNLLINTDVKTGLRLTSPDQEESAMVSRAIDRRERNLIFAEIYKNLEVTVERPGGVTKSLSLAGEPVLVFVASIRHTHSMARDINEALAEDFRNDPVFRSKLLAKGINLDAVEQIAAPIHTTGSGEIAGMELKERNALVDRYNARKVLILVSTKVLQQSFDSPKTSVVIDAVPRQTYVGVGQAGMRATRLSEGKDLAVIINTEDADHSSLTFTDFEEARGSENGVVVELQRSQKVGVSRPRRHLTPAPTDVASYSLVYGPDLGDVAHQRAVARQALSKGSSQFRYFTTEGYEELRTHLRSLAAGEKSAIAPFVEAAMPWIEATTQRLVPQYFSELTPGIQERILDAQTDALMKTTDLISKGGIALFGRFQTRFLQNLKKEFADLETEKSNSDVAVFSDLPNLGKYLPMKFFDPVQDAQFAEGLEELLERVAPETRLGVLAEDAGIPTGTKARDMGLEATSLRALRRRAIKMLETSANLSASLDWEVGLSVGAPALWARQSEDRNTRPRAISARRIELELRKNREEILFCKEVLLVQLRGGTNSLLPRVQEVVNEKPRLVEAMAALNNIYSTRATQLGPLFENSLRQVLEKAVDEQRKEDIIEDPNGNDPRTTFVHYRFLNLRNSMHSWDWWQTRKPFPPDHPRANSAAAILRERKKDEHHVQNTAREICNALVQAGLLTLSGEVTEGAPLSLRRSPKLKAHLQNLASPDFDPAKIEKASREGVETKLIKVMNEKRIMDYRRDPLVFKDNEQANLSVLEDLHYLVDQRKHLIHLRRLHQSPASAAPQRPIPRAGAWVNMLPPGTKQG